MKQFQVEQELNTRIDYVTIYVLHCSIVLQKYRIAFHTGPAKYTNNHLGIPIRPWVRVH